MKNVITLTESDLYRIVNRILKESYSEEHLKYTHPKTGDECLIKVAKRKNDGRYTAVLTCDIYKDGDESVIAELPVIKNSKESVANFICDHIERTYEILDNMLIVNDEDYITENTKYGKFEIIDEPINCSYDRESETPSWEME
jgi:hypothetical protein